MSFVEMVSTLYIQLWHGGIGLLVRHWNLYGHQMVNMLSEKVHQRLRFSVRISRFVSPPLFLSDENRLGAIYIYACVCVCVCVCAAENIFTCILLLSI